MLIDPSIRDGVLLPLLVFVIVTTYTRMYIFRLMSPTDKPQGKAEMTQRSTVARSVRLRANGGYITPSGFMMRKEFLLTPTAGRLADTDVKDPPPNPFAAFDMMKTQLVGQATYLGTFYLIQNALAGFLVLKLPFHLTERFKQLTQQGIGLASLDTSYVSSGSWYMIAQFGIQRVLQLFATSDLLDENKMMQMQMGPMAMGMGMGQPQQMWQAKQAFKAEASALGVAQYNSQLVESEKQLLAKARAASRR